MKDADDLARSREQEVARLERLTGADRRGAAPPVVGRRGVTGGGFLRGGGRQQQ
jgi:hypothetical protein